MEKLKGNESWNIAIDIIIRFFISMAEENNEMHVELEAYRVVENVCY